MLKTFRVFIALFVIIFFGSSVAQAEPPSVDDIKTWVSVTHMDRLFSENVEYLLAKQFPDKTNPKNVAIAEFIRSELQWINVEKLHIDVMRNIYTKDDVMNTISVLNTPDGKLYTDKFSPTVVYNYAPADKFIDRRSALLFDAVSNRTPLPGPEPLPEAANSQERAVRVLLMSALETAYNAEMSELEFRMLPMTSIAAQDLDYEQLKSAVRNHPNFKAYSDAMRNDITLERYILAYVPYMMNILNEEEAVALNQLLQKPFVQSLKAKDLRAMIEIRPLLDAYLRSKMKAFLSAQSKP